MVTLIHYTNFDVNPLNNLEDIEQNHLKYRSCWFKFTLRSKLGHTESLYVNMTLRPPIVWDIKQIYMAMKYRSHNPKLYDSHTSNCLQDVTWNHWTMKYRSLWWYEALWWWLEWFSSCRVDTILWQSKGNNSKSINASVMVLALCMSANVDWYLYEGSWR